MTDKSTVASAELRERWHEVESVVDRLPANQRNVFLMAEIKGYSYKEIAESMDRSVGSVRQLLNRARNKIRTRVDTDSDWFGASMPVVGADRALGSWRPLIGSKSPDWVRPRVSDLQAWLGNISQTCTDAVLQSTATFATGLAIVVLGTVPAFAPAGQDFDLTTPVASGVAVSTPQVSRPHSESTAVQIKEAKPVPTVTTPPLSDAVGQSEIVPRDKVSTDQNKPPAVSTSDYNDTATDIVLAPGTGQTPGPAPTEEAVADPGEGSGGVPPGYPPNTMRLERSVDSAEADGIEPTDSVDKNPWDLIPTDDDRVRGHCDDGSGSGCLSKTLME